MLTRPMLMLPDLLDGCGWVRWSLLLQQYDEAIKAYDKAIRLENWALFSVKQGELLWGTKAYEEAIRAYDTAI